MGLSDIMDQERAAEYATVITERVRDMYRAGRNGLPCVQNS